MIRGAWTRRGRCAALASLFVAWATPVRAQTLFERLNLDRLQLSALGGSMGPVRPTQMEQTDAYAMHADYGEITRRVRVVFTATYWGSRYTDAVVRQFEQQLLENIVDPAGDDTLRQSRVSVSDIAVAMELRWTATRSGTFLRPYLGGAASAHVINAEGRLIQNTFVENALDNIFAGVAAVAGVDLAPLARLSAGVQLRYEIMSGLRFGSGRVVATYHLDPLRRGSQDP
jgi:hypothetical protein